MSTDEKPDWAVTPDGGIIHGQPSIEAQPDAHLRRWRVFEFEDGRCLFGDDGYSGRMSTVIQEWDSDISVAVMALGRRHSLDGVCGPV